MTTRERDDSFAHVSWPLRVCCWLFPWCKVTLQRYVLAHFQKGGHAGYRDAQDDCRSCTQGRRHSS
jgi:hypothetical protein